MTMDLAIRLLELGFAIAILQRAAEHVARDGRVFYSALATLAVLLLVGAGQGISLAVIWLLLVVQFHRLDGPYNGGSDKMLFLGITCVMIARLAPSPVWAEMALGYLGVQLMLSYFVSGWIKLTNPQWRSGQALSDVFAFSAYPVSASLRRWSTRPGMMILASWAVIGFEVLFPLALLHPVALKLMLVIAALFHLANVAAFGLNRFFWTWIAAFPALVWVQARFLAV